MRIIGFSGGMGAGKSTAIEILKKELGKSPVTLVKFAQPLYDIQELIYERVQYAYKPPAGFVKDRKLLQWLGTDWGRGISENLWVDLWKAEVAEIQQFYPGVTVVCDDVRFDNEALALKAMGGHVIKLTRPAATNHAVGGVGIAGHASEAGVSQNLVDFVVNNDDDIDAFRKKLLAVFGELYAPNL